MLSKQTGPIDISDVGFVDECVSISPPARRDRLGMKSVFSSLCAGDALSSLKALRDAGRFVGKEDTVPLRLLYSRHNHSQITQDEISTRVKASSGSSAQVHGVFSVVRLDGGEREREVSTCKAVCAGEDAFRRYLSVFCLFMFALIHLLLCPCPQRGKLIIS